MNSSALLRVPRISAIAASILALGLALQATMAAVPHPLASFEPVAAAPFKDAPYLMPLANNPPSLTDVMSQSGERHFIFAFVVSDGGCTPAWETDAGLTPVSADTQVGPMISEVRAAGGDVGVSFGGYNDTELGLACGSAGALAGAYQAVISKYGLDYVDFDIEGAAFGDSSTESRRFQAISILRQNAADAGRHLTVALTIPIATVGFTGNGTDEIRTGVADGVQMDIYNVMDFDYGGSGGNQVGDDETVMTDVHTQLKSIFTAMSDAQIDSMTGLTLMNGHTDQPSELFTQTTFQSLEAYAKQNQYALLSFWAENRDRECTGLTGWVSGVCSSVTQQPYDFTKIIVQFGGPTGGPIPTPTPQTPGAPTNVAGTALGGGQALVTWSPPVVTGGSPVTYYAVYAYPQLASNPIQVVSGTSLTLSGLAPHTYYTFTVTAWNGAAWSHWSGWANWLLVT